MVGLAFQSGLWAYEGWDSLNDVTEEVKRPVRNMPWAVLGSITIVTFSYLLVNVAYLSVLTPQELKDSPATAVSLGYRVYGQTVARIIPLFVAASILGSGNGSLFSYGRVMFSAAREGHLPSFMAMIHKTKRTPILAMLFRTFLSCALLIPDKSTISTLMSLYSTAEWITYLITVIGLLWSRYRHPKLRRPFKLPIVIPVVFLLISLYLTISPFIKAPVESLISVILILTGLPVYYFFIHLKATPKCILRCIALRMVAEDGPTGVDNNIAASSGVPPKRVLGILGASSMVAGGMIGSGIFFIPRWVLVYSGSVGLAFFIWLLCGLVVFLGGLCWVELGLTFPKSGGEYILMKETLGPLPAFIMLFLRLIIVMPSAVATRQLVFAAYFIEPFFPGCADREDLVPLIKITAACSMCKYSLNLFDKFTCTYSARNMPWAVIGSISAVTCSYLVVNVAYLAVLTPQEIKESPATASSFIEKLYGSSVAWVVPVFVSASIFGSSNGSIFSAGRVMFSAAREGHLPKFLAMIHATKRTPIPALLFMNFFGCIMLIPKQNSVRNLIRMISTAAWLTNTVTTVGLLWTRYKRPALKRPLKLPIVIPVVFLLISLCLTISPFIKAPLESFISVILMLTGLPVYYFFIHLKATPKCILNCFGE
ncbi:hypothetical protein QZH41_012202 [Actinostola sp. cb2023]|nr:hypothetical protein QZH41_012202 [Actinostola sp. cb2023]